MKYHFGEYLLYIVPIIVVGYWIFSDMGFNLISTLAFIGWVMGGVGVMAFIGGARKTGAIVAVVGIVLINIALW